MRYNYNMDIKSILKDNFICLSEKIGGQYDRVAAPLFIKDFKVESFKSAKLYIIGLGLYELFINGKKITKGKLAPYFSNPNHIIYYDEYDLSNELLNGGNRLGILLGCGWLNPLSGKIWGFTEADWRASERLSLVLTIDDEIVLKSDESFYVKESHIIFNDLRCGEYHDMRLFNQKDYSYNYIDSSYKKALKTKTPKGDVFLCEADPIKERKIIKPISIKKVDDGYIYDFGENLAGIPRFKIKGHRGQLISLWHFEALLDGHFYNKNTCTPDQDRYMSQKDILICSGDNDTFEPSFTYHGFRYIYLEGSEGIECELEMVQISSSIFRRASFTTDNEIINKLQHITLNSDLSNFFYFPTDCPQREKNGWTGDASLSAEQLLLNFDSSNSLKVWLDNIRKAQREDGQLPGLIPTYKFGYDWGNGPNWDSVLVELPYHIYKYTGDKKVIYDNSDAIYKYLSVNIINRLNEDGLINYGLGDWCEADSPLEHVYSTPVEVTDTLEVIDMLEKAYLLFKTINDDERALFSYILSNKLKDSFKKKWVENFSVKCATQTAQAFAIKVGIFNNDEIKDAVSNLISLIHSNNDLMKYGVIGNKVIYDVLSENGYSDLALKLITQDKYPSLKYWLDNGATSLWEAINELEPNHLLRKDGGRVLSLNHHFWGTISAFFFKYICGLNVNPNMENENEIKINPYIFKDINYVKCEFKGNNDNYIEYEVLKQNDTLKVNILKLKGFKII